MAAKRGFVVEKNGVYGYRVPKLQTEAGRAAFGLALSAAGYNIVKANVPSPSIRTLEKWSDDGICKTPCGCRVEPDGHCSHGSPSWLLLLHFI
jgi:hypothetical protein